MSGQPNINPSDAMKFRQQYLANLDLRAKLDDVNLQANKVYKRTGQLPVEPSDFRTMEEKLADTERLKIEVRSKLSDITDGKEANKIAQELTPKQMVFYIQSAEAINKEIKPKYRLGIYAEIFIPFLQNYMNTKANVNGIQTGLQQTSGTSVELNKQDIMNSYFTKREISDWSIRASPAIRNMGIDKRLIGRLQQNIILLGNLTHMILGMTDDLRDTYVIDSDDKNRAYKLINDIIQEFPTKVQFNKWVDKSFMYARSNDKAGLTKHIEELIEITTLIPERRELVNELEGIMRGVPVKTRTPANLVPGKGGSSKSLERGYIPEPSTFDDFSKKDLVKWARSNGISVSSTMGQSNKHTLMNYLESKWTADMIEEDDDSMSDVSTGLDTGKTTGESKSKMSDYYAKGKGMKGRGVATQYKPSVDWYGGISPTPKFVPFGKYIINKHRLENNIIAVKRPAGSSIKEFPSERVSRKLGGIIRGITNNEMPDFDDLNDLDDGEKIYLNKLAEKTNLKDRLILPTPNKSAIDKEIDGFEVMKGEIMSGNDNKDLVRKFKSTLLKLSNKGVIPKSQFKDLLLELTEMGF